MNGNANGNREALRQLRSPARNNYFYGKLLNVTHFEMEQRYFNRKRWLLNRLEIGAGILCGLEVEAEGADLIVRPGVAIDPLGREIIVPERRRLETVSEELEEEEQALVCLHYHECEVEMVPVLVSDCDVREECAPSTIRERYRLELSTEPLPPAREICAILFTDEGVYDRVQVEEALQVGCAPPDRTCVVLARISLGTDGLVVEAEPYRTYVYSNTMLWELISCLATQMERCCRILVLRYLSGDGQEAAPGEELPEPLVVRVVDEGGNPVSGETVTFRVRSGGGSIVGDDKVDSGGNGKASARWRLGTEGTLQTAEAYLASGGHVAFTALATEEEDGPPPRECIDFEDLELDNSYEVNETFTSAGVEITGRPITLAGGQTFDEGNVRVIASGRAGGSGKELAFRSINLAFDFGAPIPGLTLAFARRITNLRINGELMVFDSVAELDGAVVGGVRASVPGAESEGPWTLSLQGTIRGAFVIGGEELMIDDLCPGERQPDQPFPVVTDIWPPNAGVLAENDQWLQRWEEQPRVALTFNRFMDARQLREPEEWLRVFEIGEEDEETTVRRLALSFVEDSTFPAPETAVYALDAQLDDPTVRYLVIARAENDNIVDRSDPAQMLDADFEGTELSSDQIEVVWPLEDDVLDNAFWAALVDTGARLPESGDGSAGGWFHSWFAITLQNQ